MVKKLITQLSACIMLIALLTACSKSSDYTYIIPADATAVASIHLKSIIDKTSINNKENEGFKQKILGTLKTGVNAATFQHLEKVIQNSSELGIDVTSPFYLFSSTSFPYPIIVGKVNNEDKLRESLDIMAKEQLCQPINETDAYGYTTMDDILLAFTNSAIIISITDGTSQTDKAKESITTWLKQTAEQSFVNSGAFKTMRKKDGDVNFCVSITALPSMYYSQAMMVVPNEVNLEEVSLIGELNFEKGKIALNTEYYTESEVVKALIKKQEQATKKGNYSFAKYFPASTLAFFNVGVRGEEFSKILHENKEIRDIAPILQAKGVKDLLENITGDISFGLINVTMNTVPTFLLYTDIKDGKALEEIYKNKATLGLSKREDIVALGKDEYVYKTRNSNVFFGVKEKQLFATNDELLYKGIGKAVDKSIKNAPYASDMKGKTFFGVINAEAILELPVVKFLTGFGGEEIQVYNQLAGKVSYLSIHSEGKTSTIELCLKDKDTNALQQIVDFAKQFTGTNP